MLTELLNRGCDPHIVNSRGETPLHLVSFLFYHLHHENSVQTLCLINPLSDKKVVKVGEKHNFHLIIFRFLILLSSIMYSLTWLWLISSFVKKSDIQNWHFIIFSGKFIRLLEILNVHFENFARTFTKQAKDNILVQAAGSDYKGTAHLQALIQTGIHLSARLYLCQAFCIRALCAQL